VSTNSNQNYFLQLQLSKVKSAEVGAFSMLKHTPFRKTKCQLLHRIILPSLNKQSNKNKPCHAISVKITGCKARKACKNERKVARFISIQNAFGC